MKSRGLGFTILIIVICIIICCLIYFKGDAIGLRTPTSRSFAGMGVIGGTLFFIFLRPLYHMFNIWGLARIFRGNRYTPPQGTAAGAQGPVDPWAKLHLNLKQRYGRRWKKAKPWLLVLGGQKRVEKWQPELVKGWHDGRDAVLIKAEESYSPENWKKLRGGRYRPPDGLVVIPNSIKDWSQTADKLMELNQALGWRLPVYLVLVDEKFGPVPEANNDEQTYPVVGLKLVPGEAERPQLFADMASSLSYWLAERSVNDLSHDLTARFAGNVSRFLQKSEVLSRYVAGLSGRMAKNQAVKGVFFSPAGLSGLRAADESLIEFLAENAKKAKSTPLKWGFRDYAWRAVVASCLIWALYLPISFMINVSRMANAAYTADYLTELKSTGLVWPELTRMQEELEAREKILAQKSGRRFPSLNRDRDLLNIHWQVYGRVCRHWLIAPFFAETETKLTNLNNRFRQESQMPSDEEIQSGYSALKAYLMFDRPDKKEPDFLAAQLASSWRRVDSYVQPETINQVARFYAEHYQAAPAWQLPVKGLLVDLSRKTLVDLIGLKEADEYLYQDLMERGRTRYPDLALTAIMGGHDYSAVWFCQEKIPGVFTRQAWDGYVEETIKHLSTQLGRANDWVLNENPGEAAEENFDRARQKMTEKYFRDYAAAWGKFLNSIKWRKRNELSEITEQLKVYSDPQLSPLPVLIRAAAYQGQAGVAARGRADVLVEKTQSIFRLSEPAPMEQPEATDPADRFNAGLIEIFGPFIRLAAANGAAQPAGETGVSLSGYMDRLTRTRVRLEQVMNSGDPGVMARQVTKVAFQGQSNDLTGSQQYGALVSAGFGAQWSGVCDNIFIQPLDLTWEELVKSTLVNLNQLWRDSVFDPWNEEFAGLYPFNGTMNDASIPSLSRFLHPDRGLVLKFINENLAGVLERQGDKWVPNPLLANSLNFDEQFLFAVNSLVALSNHLFNQGDARYYFELMPLPSPTLEETEIKLDGQSVRYVNQKSTWSPMTWPGDPMVAGVRLTWRTTKAGLKKEREFPGRWSLARLLEEATIEQVDAARFQLRWRMPDGESIYYMMRVEAGAGPLELLDLRNFRMPVRIFAERPEGPPAVARSGKM